MRKHKRVCMVAITAFTALGLLQVKNLLDNHDLVGRVWVPPQEYSQSKYGLKEAELQHTSTLRLTRPTLDMPPPPGEHRLPISDICSGPTFPPELSKTNAKDLLSRILKTSKSWGYASLGKKWAKHKGLNVLDVGMGQGPIGVIALQLGGVKTYTGLDPALCIDKRARTRFRNIKRTFSKDQCQEMLAECNQKVVAKDNCTDYIHCSTELDKKYQRFPFTGIEMMQALPGRLKLLPGTFETVGPSGMLQRGAFDVATMHAVTEHLPNVRLVIEGIYEMLLPGQCFCSSHHNYYGYGGHHQWPQKPSDFDKQSSAQREFASWRHVDSDSIGAAQNNTNRLRLGDLAALISVYFDCAFRTDTYEGVKERLTDGPLLLLQSRGFSEEELHVEHMHVQCARRASPLDRSWLDRAVWYHPPLDGNYEPQRLPSDFAAAMRNDVSINPERGVQRPNCL